MTTLFIDSSNNQKIIIRLDINGAKHEVVSEARKIRGSQVILPLIDHLLSKNKLTLKDLTHLEVNPGPGSYTGLRVGIAIANALSFTLSIPINSLPIGELLKPNYE